MKSKTAKCTAVIASMAALASAGSGSASAATTISYSYYTATSSTDTSWVSPNGSTSVKAVNFGGGETTFGGVTWLAGNGNTETQNEVAPIAMFFHAPGKACRSSSSSPIGMAPNSQKNPIRSKATRPRTCKRSSLIEGRAFDFTGRSFVTIPLLKPDEERVPSGLPGPATIMPTEN